ncbi:hypothetical protein RUM43_007040 [Polyplax serrata]|uniref:Uncharacterized protein n=1 Tax=Polyplax serrata TaxID=468196 RepID=A0AAN8PLG5_POLSC
MEKLHFYLSNGLWKIAEKCFDPNSKLQNEFLWSVAVHPNVHRYHTNDKFTMSSCITIPQLVNPSCVLLSYNPHGKQKFIIILTVNLSFLNSFGSHIIATPWQQCWMALNILEGDNDGRVVPKKDEIDLLRKEIDFQYTLRKHWSDPFVQQLFSLYSKIQTHVPVSFSESETKNFNSNLMNLLTLLLKESPSTAHSFLTQLLQHGIFAGTCESILNEMDKSNEHLCNLIVSTLCKTDSVSPHSSQIVSVLQTSLKSNLCLLLLANDKIDIIHSMIEEHKKLFRSNSAMRLQNLLDNGIEPLSCFSDMVIMERHFLLQIIDLLNSHLDEFPLLSKSKNIPPFTWPLILLYNWDNPKLSDSILLQLIEKCKEATKDKTITQITYILEWYISFCRWCEKHEISENKEDKLSKQNLLKKAKEHSVLYLINNTTDLSVTDWSQIRALLQHGKSSDTEDKKSWDLVLFDGYCCMIMVFQAIISADEIYRMAQAQKVNLEDIHSLNGAFASLYNDTVTQNLKKVKAMLQSLYPVAFRLEILENIFASIFTTYEDMKKFNYFLNCSFNLDKYLEKVQAKNKFSFSEKPSRRNLTSTAGNVPASQVYEEEEANKKLKLRGFMCKKYIVRDLIYLVKECLEKLEEDSGAQNQSVSVDVPCSIKPSQMENRLDRLLESVSEATWRLQLVTDPEFISQIGTMQFACGKNSNHHFDGEWIYLQQELDRCGFLKTRKKSNEKADEIGSHRSSSTGNENLTSSELQMYSMQSRSVNGPAIMNQMLSCDSSLVVQCLSRGDVLNADHIIQVGSVNSRQFFFLMFRTIQFL